MKKIFFLILILPAVLLSQELNCRVVVNYESLPVINKEQLGEFKGAVQDYLNQTRFTDDWKYNKVDCTFNIYITNASSEINYTAQAIISAQRPIYKSDDNSLLLSLNDNSWSFKYEKGQALYVNDISFDPLTSFLDYYANVILGFYAESWEQGGGTYYFARAFDIVNFGANSAFSGGWERNSNSYSRRGLVEDFGNEKYRPFKDAYYDYYYGIDIFRTKPDEAMEYIASLVLTLEEMKKKTDLNGVLLKTFFDAKHGEIIDYLKSYPKKVEIFTKLKKIDPSHASKYDAAMS